MRDRFDGGLEIAVEHNGGLVGRRGAWRERPWVTFDVSQSMFGQSEFFDDPCVSDHDVGGRPAVDAVPGESFRGGDPAAHDRILLEDFDRQSGPSEVAG